MWRVSTETPEGVVLLTKISDEDGERIGSEANASREQKLVRKGNLWFVPDMSSYVYYRPTHWRYP